MTSASSRTIAANLIRSFTAAGGFSFSAVAVKNSLPHLARHFRGADYIAALRNLGADLKLVQVRMKDLAETDLPCLFLTRSLPSILVLKVRDGDCLVLIAGEEKPRWLTPTTAKGTAVRIDPNNQAGHKKEEQGVADTLAGFRGVVARLLVASLFTNLAALAPPFLVMVIYDQIIPTRSIDAIVAFGVATCVVVIFDISLRTVRVMTIAHMGSRVEKRLGLALFRKLSHLPLSNLEKSGVQEQISRLRQFEGFREVFSGSLFTTFLDLPFVLIFVAVLFYLAPAVGLFLLGIIAIFVIASLVSYKIQQRYSEQAAATKSAQQQQLYEASKNVLAIQRFGAEDFWTERLAQATEASADAARRGKRVQLIAQTFGQSLMMSAGVGAIAFGTLSAIEGDVSIGALIALMTLVWRILGPIQALYAGVSQLKGFITGLRQIMRVLSLNGEFVREESSAAVKKFTGKIEVANVSHRFNATQDPVLSGVSLTINPGEITVFCGLSGAGRSTLFNLMNRLYTPTAGAIYFDDVDYRQIAVNELRRAVTSERQYADFFHGTIQQNFELSNPAVTLDEIWVVLQALELDGYVRALPDGVDTRMDEDFQNKMSRSLGKGLGLARCLLRDSSIYLLDEPCSGLDTTHEHRFLTCLNALRGRRTVLLTSDRPSHWDLADTIVFMDRGRVLINEPRATALPKVRALYQQAGADS